jgi:RNA polymerase sigma-70 factor, ECF subfamily
MNGNDSRTDEELVELSRTKDQEQYACLVDRYQHRLMRYALGLLRDGHKAEDVVQEAFIKAFINLNAFDTKKKFSSWMYRIVHNEAMNSIKKYHKEIPLLEHFDFVSSQDIEEEFAEKELLVALNDCIDGLPVLYSAPLTLYYIEEKSYEEISDILHLPMGTVATRISRAKRLMKKICQKK